MLALQHLLNSGREGDFRCVYVNVEAGQAMREDVERAMRTILGALSERAQLTLDDDFPEKMSIDVLDRWGAGTALAQVLRRWAREDSRPLVLLLVLLIDEIDSLVGDTLISVLRHLRSGYNMRPRNFPQSVVLCGVRDLRDYRIDSGSTGRRMTGGSAFNISAASLRLGDLSREDVVTLLGQHTAETGQEFSEEAVERVWSRTSGQPWLVNALCEQACFKSRHGTDRARAVTKEAIVDAEEGLIQRRVVHLDQLADKLSEERVRRVIEPLLSGGSRWHYSVHDLEYVQDLGLVALDEPLRIANPIYAEVVLRELTWETQQVVLAAGNPYADEGGGLDMARLLSGFQEFYRENSEHWIERYQYKEAGPQLLLQAFLQRVVNGAGRIEREYALGRLSTDLLVEWPWRRGVQKFVVECKFLKGSRDSAVRKGVEQTVRHMDRCGATQGHLLLFDHSDRPREERQFRRSERFLGKLISVWGSLFLRSCAGLCTGSAFTKPRHFRNPAEHGRRGQADSAAVRRMSIALDRLSWRKVAIGSKNIRKSTGRPRAVGHCP